MAKYDPNKRREERKEQGLDRGGPDLNRIDAECRAPMAAVGFEGFKSSRKGTPGWHIMFVILEGEHVGRVVTRDLWRTQAAQDQIGDLAVAVGYPEPFDTDDDKDMARVLKHGGGVFMGVVKKKTFERDDGSEGHTFEVSFFNEIRDVKRRELTEARKAVKKQGVGEWQKYLAWRAENPRPEPTGVSDSDDGGAGYDDYDEDIGF